jgi:hypothetical protein
MEKKLSFTRRQNRHLRPILRNNKEAVDARASEILASEISNDTPIRRAARANQIKYKSEKYIIEKWLTDRHIPPQTEIWIFPNYPDGYLAVVGAQSMTWIFDYYYGHISIRNIHMPRGFRANGAPIFTLTEPF